jgi:hypothetical protein
MPTSRVARRLAAATAIGLGAVTIATLDPLDLAGAQEQEQEQPADERQRPPMEGRHPHRRGPIRAAAEAIGIEPQELADALRDGATVAEVAEANGVEPQAVVDALTAQAAERIDEFVFRTGPDD